MQWELVTSLAGHILVLLPLTFLVGSHKPIVKDRIYTVRVVNVPPVTKTEKPRKETTGPAPKDVHALPEPVPSKPSYSRRMSSEKKPSLRERIESRLKERDDRVLGKTEERARQNKSSDVTTDYTLRVEDFPYEWYVAVLRRKLDEAWSPPKELMVTEEAAAVVSFEITRNGKVTNLVLSSSSGKTLLDSSAIEAITSSEPFPPLPPGYDSNLQVSVRFRVFPGQRGIF